MRLLVVGVFAFTLGCETRDRAPAPSSASGVKAAPIGPIPGAERPAREPPNPLAGDRIAEVDGRRLFVSYNCAGCHGGRAGGGMGPSLRDPVWLYGNSAVDIFSSISQGRGHGMPAWGTKLPDDHVWRLVAYIQSLGTDHEPERPR
jgi:cytochrome c oxidase cbb3-type subunit 3